METLGSFRQVQASAYKEKRYLLETSTILTSLCFFLNGHNKGCDFWWWVLGWNWIILGDLRSIWQLFFKIMKTHLFSHAKKWRWLLHWTQAAFIGFWIWEKNWQPQLRTSEGACLGCKGRVGSFFCANSLICMLNCGNDLHGLESKTENRIKARLACRHEWN